MGEYKIRETKLYIYGCGDRGKKVQKLLEKNGVTVVGYIDSRANDVKTFQEIPVVSLDDILRSDKKDCVIIFTFKNVFEHNDIAIRFQNNGFYNLIFRPLNTLNNGNVSKKLQMIGKIHELIVDKAMYWDEWVPSINGTSLFEYQDCALIEENEELCKAYLPSEIFFMPTRKDLDIWSNANIMAVHPAVDMYVGFRENRKDNYVACINEFVEKMAVRGAKRSGIEITEKWEDHVIDGRRSVYNSMKRKQSLDKDFFVRHCVTVSAREQGGFSLVSSGKNRVSFLIAEGYQYIPASMSKDDYRKYLNLNKLTVLIEFIESNKLVPLFAPIPHPYFYNCSYKADNYVEVWIKKICRIIARYLYCNLGNCDFSNISILDALCDDGCSSRFFLQLGCDILRIRKQKNNIETMLDDFFEVTIPIIEDKKIEKKGILILFIDSKDGWDIYKEVEYLNPKFCFVQVYNSDETIINELGKKGYSCHSLFISYWDKDLVEGYFCYKFLEEKIVSHVLLQE